MKNVKSLAIRVRNEVVTRSYVLALVIIAAFVFLAFSPLGLHPAAASFSLDASTLLDSASDIFNALWPAFGLLAGIALGMGLIKLIIGELRKAF